MSGHAWHGCSHRAPREAGLHGGTHRRADEPAEDIRHYSRWAPGCPCASGGRAARRRADRPLCGLGRFGAAGGPRRGRLRLDAAPQHGHVLHVARGLRQWHRGGGAGLPRRVGLPDREVWCAAGERGHAGHSRDHQIWTYLRVQRSGQGLGLRQHVHDMQLSRQQHRERLLLARRTWWLLWFNALRPQEGGRRAHPM